MGVAGTDRSSMAILAVESSPPTEAWVVEQVIAAGVGDALSTSAIRAFAPDAAVALMAVRKMPSVPDSNGPVEGSAPANPPTSQLFASRVVWLTDGSAPSNTEVTICPMLCTFAYSATATAAPIEFGHAAKTLVIPAGTARASQASTRPV